MGFSRNILTCKTHVSFPLKTRHSTFLLDVDAIASKVLEGPRREAATELLGSFGITVGQPWSREFKIRTI